MRFEQRLVEGRRAGIYRGHFRERDKRPRWCEHGQFKGHQGAQCGRSGVNLGKGVADEIREVMGRREEGEGKPS